ncbi:conserved hypothetical protein [Ricinus communis]|uniref:Uncharacterized protein n=1 Tax=Ricinus communis TaxID=3988 RepID=B9RPZ5_RICCO|nr:conserved hypothetical protein [Ricinus communis]
MSVDFKDNNFYLLFDRSIRESAVSARRISVPLKIGALPTTASDLKGGSKFEVKTKGKSVSSAIQDVNVRRKPLADLSNKQSAFSRNVDGFKPLRILGPHKKGAPLTNASDSKGDSKFGVKIEWKSVSSDVNVRRKPLVDLSNKQTTFSRNVKHDGSKSMISVDPGSRTVNISRRCSLGRMSINHRVGNSQATRKGVKDLISFYNALRINTKNLDNESAINNKRTTKNSVGSVRKSLPVLVTTNQADSCYTKVDNNEEGPKQVKRNKGLSGKGIRLTNLCKAKMNKHVVTQVSTCRRYLQRNRASDGFIKM